MKKVQPLSLIQHIMEVEVYKFHGFIWALVNSNQSQLAELLGFAVHDYLDVDVYLKSSSFQCPACCDFYTKAYILTGCGHYVCAPCVKGTEFMRKDNQNKDITCPVPECHKITETLPSVGGNGLEEDDDFDELCKDLLKEVRKTSCMTTEKIAITVKKEEEEMSTTGSEEEVGLSQPLQGGICDLETKICCLQKYRDVLEKHKPGVKDYITGAVEKVKQKVDEQGIETLACYSSLCQKVDNNLVKFVKWQNAASELSVIMNARPELRERCLKGKINLPQEIVTDAAEKLITQLDAGCPIPSLLTHFPYITKPPVKAKFLMKYALPGDTECYKLAWMPDSSLMVLNVNSLQRVELNIETAECKPALIKEASPRDDMSVAADGTWVTSLLIDGIVDIHYPGVKKAKRWIPGGIDYPGRVFINNDNIFVADYFSQIVRSYSRELVYLDQYDIGIRDVQGDLLVTKRGRLVKTAESKDKIYTVDLETRETSSFGRKGKPAHLTYPTGCCTVCNDEYLLVADWNDNNVSVFTHDGQFIHHLEMEGVRWLIHCVAVLARRGQPSLMALGRMKEGGGDEVYIYSLA